MEQKHSRPHRERQLTKHLIIHKAQPRLITMATETSLNGPRGRIKKIRDNSRLDMSQYANIHVCSNASIRTQETSWVHPMLT